MDDRRVDGIVTKIGVRLPRRILRGLQSSSDRVGSARRVSSGLVLVPVFGVIVVAGRAASALRSPIVMIAEAGSGRFRCQLPDLVQMYIATFGVWEPDVTAFIRSSLGSGDVCVDIGANIGWCAVAAADAVGDEGRVVAVEASPSMAAELRENIRRSGHEGRVRVAECAASAERGTLTIYSGPAHNRGLATTVAGRGFSAECEVPALPLVDILEPDELSRVRLIKVDVEGGEFAVLEGVAKSIGELPDDVEILVELSPRWWPESAPDPAEALRPFMDAGFNLYMIPNNYWPWRYLWPRDVARPMRLRDSIDRKIRRIDLVLSRKDQEHL